MPKALFFNVPAHGHVNPSLPLVAELTKRGHHIIYFITENFRAKVEAVGAEFRPYVTIDDDYFSGPGLNGTRPQFAAHRLITTTGEVLPELLEAARRVQPDYILYDGMCPWGYMVAKILGLPAVESLSLMAFGTSPISAMLKWDVMRPMMNMVRRDFSKGLAANRLSQALGKQYDVRPLGMMEILSAPADLAISYTSKAYQPYADTVGDHIRFVGRTVSNAPTDSSFSFEQVNGRRLVYISLGTLSNEDASFFRTCIEAFSGTDDYVIMSTGNRLDPKSFGTLPENIAIYSWVPQFDVLKRASLFVSHAGLNSVHDGLYFGVPLLLVPQQDEQEINAYRVVELGAGLMLRKSQVNVEAIKANAARLLSDSRFKDEAKRIGETLRAAGGMPRAADEIEALLGKHVKVH